MLTIRTATETDAAAVAAIVVQSFRKQAELLRISQVEYPHYVAFETEANVRRRIEDGAYVALASSGDKFIGTVSCVCRRDEPAEIRGLRCFVVSRESLRP
jgi:hypothetical protein